MLNSSSDLYGASKVFGDMARILKEAGHEIHVVLSAGGPLVDELQKQGIEVRLLRLGVIRRKYFNLPGMVNRLFYLGKTSLYLVKFIKKKEVDIVYANTSAVINGAILKFILGKKIYHLWHIHEIIKNSWVFNSLTTLLMSHLMDKCVCVSDAVVSHWSDQLSLKNRKKLIRIYNGFDLETLQTSSIRQELKIPDNVVVITMVGRINKIKGQEFFVAIAKEILKRKSNVIFLMAGDTYPGYEWLEEELRENVGLDHSQIKMLGFRNDISNILIGSDIFVQPSILPDSLPTTILEAMACHLPVVTTVTGGAGEMVRHDYNGYHIEVWNVESAVQKLEALIEDGALRLRFGERGYEFLKERFSYEQFKANTLDLFKNLVK